MDFASLGFKVDSRELKKGKADLETFGNQGKKTSADIQKGSAGVTKGFGAMASAIKTVVAAYATLKLASYVKESAMLAARYETLGIVLSVVGENAGYTADQMEAVAKSLQKSGISMIESRSVLTKMVQAQIDLNDATKLARIAQDAAVIGNINSSEAFDRMIHGIQAGMPLILRNIGIQVDFEEGYKRTAKALNTTTDALNAQQKMQSRVDTVMLQGAKIAGTYEAAMTTAGKQITSFPRYLEDFKVKFGEAFNPSTAKLVMAATDAMKKFTEEISNPETQQTLAYFAELITDIIQLLGVGIVESVPLAIRGLAGIAGVLNEISYYSLKVSEGLYKAFAASNRLYSLLGTNKESKAYYKRQAEAWEEMARQDKAAGSAYWKRSQTFYDIFLYGKATPKEDEGSGSWWGDVKPKKGNGAGEIRDTTTATKELADATAEAKRIFEATRTPFENYATTMERLNQLLKAGAIDQDTYGRASKQALDEMNNAVEKTKDGFEELQQAIEGWGKDSAEAIVDFAMTGKSSFSDMIQSMIKDLAKMILYQQIMKPLAGAISSGSSGWLSSLASFVGSLFGVGGSTSIPAGVGLWHGGGVVGYDKPQTAFVNPALFAGAPRLHKGLAPDEYPAILQRGETVTPKGGSIAPTINIINNAGAEISTDMQEVNGGMQIDVMIDQVVAKKMGQFGSSSNKVLRSNFSAKERLIRR